LGFYCLLCAFAPLRENLLLSVLRAKLLIRSSFGAERFDEALGFSRHAIRKLNW
jgi:hypothetical protein